ncbi:hypothetical protein VPH184E373B_0198 [Vibrio phage 184E37-3b]|nr:hypothetical protein MYOV056v2_p0174 [Vibrio phage 184E37.3a]QZI90131.1 hypothetical protein MYOV057v1_p0216 [Vibrio phage 184E37.1]
MSGLSGRVMKVDNFKDMVRVLKYKNLYFEDTEHFFLLGIQSYKFLKGDRVLNLEVLESFKAMGLSYKSHHLGGLVFEKAFKESL